MRHASRQHAHTLTHLAVPVLVGVKPAKRHAHILVLPLCDTERVLEAPRGLLQVALLQAQPPHVLAQL